jgi:hypothetical protein
MKKPSAKPKRHRSTPKEVEDRLAEIVECHKAYAFRNALDLADHYSMPRSFARRIMRESIHRGLFKDSAAWKQFFTKPHARAYRYRCPRCHYMGGQERVAL